MKSERIAASRLSPAQRPLPLSPGIRILGWAFLAVLAAWAVIIATHLSEETASWQLAAALEKRLDGDVPEALALLSKAAKNDEQNPEILLWRATCYLEAGQLKEAHDDFVRLLELKPKAWNWYLSRAEVRLRLQNPAGAIEDVKKSLQVFEDEHPEKKDIRFLLLLNGVAYYRAVANQELDAALDQANLVVKKFGGRPEMLSSFGFLRHLQGHSRQGLKWLNAAAKELESDYESTEQERDAEKVETKRDRIDERLLQLSSRLCRIHFRRLLVFEALGTSAEAAKAQQRIRDLNGNLLELKRTKASQRQLVFTVQQNAVVLDTLGFVHYRRNERFEAFRDLNFAVEQIEAVAEAWFTVHRGESPDLRELRIQERSFKQGLAVIRYHRSLICDKMRQNKVADKDRQRIQELGFEAGPDLF